MAEDIVTSNDTEVSTRIYEIGYHIVPTIAEESLEKVVGAIRSRIEKAGGSFISEGAPAMIRLAYAMETREGERHIEHDRAYFGWIKFESTIEASQEIDAALKADSNVLRHIIFRTVREETRARLKAPTIREVKRTDTIKPTRRVEEASAPVSEADLEKALQDITAE